MLLLLQAEEEEIISTQIMKRHSDEDDVTMTPTKTTYPPIIIPFLSSHVCVSLLCLCVCVYLVATTIPLSFNQRAVPPPSHHHHSMRIPLTFLVCCASNPQVDLSLFLLLYISVSLVFFLPFLKMSLSLFYCVCPWATPTLSTRFM